MTLFPNQTPKVAQIAAKIILVDAVNNRIECVPKQGTVITLFLTTFPTFFVWPQVGEFWMIQRQNNSWILVSRIQNPNDSVPLTNSLDPGTAYAHADTIVLSTGSSVLSSDGLKLQEGANASQGVVTLVAGSAIIANTSVTANSRIQLTIQQDGITGTPGSVRVSSRVVGVSFTITSSSNTDSSKVAYQISEPAT